MSYAFSFEILSRLVGGFYDPCMVLLGVPTYYSYLPYLYVYLAEYSTVGTYLPWTRIL